jgi:predicted GNAT family N-acyltransferase
MTIALRCSWAKDLDAATVYELFKRRVEGFVVEQSISYPGLDRRDLLAETRHFWLEGPDVRSWGVHDRHARTRRSRGPRSSAPPERRQRQN